MNIFLTLKHLDAVFILLLNIYMPSIVGMLTSMSRIYFMLSRVEHKKVLYPQAQWDGSVSSGSPLSNHVSLNLTARLAGLK